MELGRSTYSTLRFLLAALAVFLVTVAPAASAPTTPTPLWPNGDTFDGPPAMGWNKVTGADHYEVQVAADAGFNPQLFLISTKNTRATLTKALVSGDYWWRVHAVDSNGNVSPWSAAQSFVIDWSAQPTLTAPADGATVAFPDSPLTLKWSSVPRAQKYRLTVASDLTLTNKIGSSSAYPVDTQALQYTVPESLAAGTYYWAVTPVDAQGNLGAQSEVHSFVWSWPHQPTNPQVTDLDADPDDQHFDPQFSWDPVPGAASYELEITSADASGSLVFSGTTIATTFAPNEIFQDNVYNWRVRAVDVGDHRGSWTDGPQFDRAFDKNGPAIENLRLVDYVTGANAVDADGGTAGFQTQVPILAWNPVPGASSYEVQIAPYSGACNFNAVIWDDMTASTSWAPLGKTTKSAPFPSPVGVSKTGSALTQGSSYCARVRARSGHKGNIDVRGAFTLLNDGTGAAFTWTGSPTTSACSPSCASGYLGSDDYLLPARTSTVTRMPLFTWEPVDGALSYWVIVAKDANFSNIIDEAFTRIPAYAPRNSLKPTTYSDETTTYYWAILPANAINGSDGLPLDLPNSAKGSFQKQSTPPTLVSPVSVQSFLDQPRFQWTPVLGARRYRLQVSADPTFGDPLDDVLTDATSYSSDTTYPADTVLYWRVRADDENLTGLTWSATGTFQKRLAAPVPSALNPSSGESLPVWAWSPVQGAASYDLSVDQPDGTHRDFNGFRTPTASFIKMTGTGVWHWRVRAQFPKDLTGSVPGPYSPTQSFTRTIGEPANAKTDSAKDHVLLSWNARLGVKEYKVQIASSPDFSRTVESVTTDNTSYAPTMTSYSWTNGGPFFWRVAGVDEDRNQGDWTQAQQINLQPGLRVSVSGVVRHGRRSSLRVSVSDGRGKRIIGARVRLTGKGIKAVAKRTNSRGQVTFKLRPRKRGKIVVSVTKAGYQSAYTSVRVR